MDFDRYWGHSGVGVFTFIIAIVLIGSFFSYLKTKSRNETIREVVRSGREFDPALLESLKREDDGPAGYLTGGLILIAVAAGLVFMGYQIGQVSGDPEVGPIMRGVAAIPGLIGVALTVVGLGMLAFRKKNDA